MVMEDITKYKILSIQILLKLLLKDKKWTWLIIIKRNTILLSIKWNNHYLKFKIKKEISIFY